jgi:hypothetical protein
LDPLDLGAGHPHGRANTNGLEKAIARRAAHNPDWHAQPPRRLLERIASQMIDIHFPLQAGWLAALLKQIRARSPAGARACNWHAAYQRRGMHKRISSCGRNTLWQ